MDYSVDSSRSSLTRSIGRNESTVMPASLHGNEHNFSTNTSNIDPNPMGRLAGTLLSAITGSSVAMADDAVDTPTTAPTPPATSRYTGNSCNSDGVTKSIGEGGLIGGASMATTGAIAGTIVGPEGTLVGAVAGAAYGLIGGTVTGGVAHELGCN